jgi:hypothetical protein
VIGYIAFGDAAIGAGAADFPQGHFFMLRHAPGNGSNSLAGRLGGSAFNVFNRYGLGRLLPGVARDGCLHFYFGENITDCDIFPLAPLNTQQNAGGLCPDLYINFVGL